MRYLASALPLTLALALACGCKSLPDVNLATKEPLKVDINVRLDVYQYNKPEGRSSPTSESLEAVLKRQNNRMEEVQKIKNGRFVGEDHQGLLSPRDLPADTYGEYIKKTVQEENADREYLMRETARKENTELAQVREKAWKLTVEKAFVGEWIEVPSDKEGLYRWEQKK